MSLELLPRLPAPVVALVLTLACASHDKSTASEKTPPAVRQPTAMVAAPSASSDKQIASRGVASPPSAQQAVKPGHYRVVLADPGYCADLRSQDKGKDDERVQLSDCKEKEIRQSFYFGRPDAEGWYTIHALGSGQGNDAKYVMNPGLGGYSIAANNKALSAPDPLIQDLFRWWVSPNTNGTYSITSKTSLDGESQCWDARDQDLEPAGMIQILKCNDSRNQRWKLEPLD
jgi:hypothetical protein